MLLVHFQRYGHTPIALMGGATGLIGDPSGKTKERKLLSRDELQHNLSSMQKQLESFLDFNSKTNPAKVVNNYDWFESIGFIEFLRDAGKYITVNYMLAKESVKKRMDSGLSFTEFSYQMLQAYDFYWLYQNMDCRIQMGGSDQFGNICTGTELIRRKIRGSAYALTGPLLTNADGSKFGKSEGGNIWLDPKLTSPYKFYQYWLNLTDADSVKIIKMLTLIDPDQIDQIIIEHEKTPHLRLLQRAIAADITIRVHSKIDFENSRTASEFLFKKGNEDKIKELSEEMLLNIFEGVPQKNVPKSLISSGINIVELLANETDVFPSKGELRRMIKNNGLSVNRKKVTSEIHQIGPDDLLSGNIIVVQKGKKNYVLIKAD
jgi:tyrosyl-tRNA synthetase